MTVRTSPIALLQHVTGVNRPYAGIVVPAGQTWIIKSFAVQNGLASSLQHRLELFEPQAERAWPLWRQSVGAGAVVFVPETFVTAAESMSIRFQVESPNSSASSSCALYGTVLVGDNPAWAPSFSDVPD